MDKTLLNIYVTNGKRLPQEQFDILPDSLKRSHVLSFLSDEHTYLEPNKLNYLTNEEFSNYLKKEGNLYEFEEIASDASPDKLQIYVENVINTCLNGNCMDMNSKVFQMSKQKLKPKLIANILKPENFTEDKMKRGRKYFNTLSFEDKIETYKLIKDFEPEPSLDSGWIMKNQHYIQKNILKELMVDQDPNEIIPELVKNEIYFSEEDTKKLSDEAIKLIVFHKLNYNKNRTDGGYIRLFKTEFEKANHNQKMAFINHLLVKQKNNNNSFYKLQPHEQQYLENHG